MDSLVEKAHDVRLLAYVKPEPDWKDKSNMAETHSIVPVEMDCRR